MGADVKGKNSLLDLDDPLRDAAEAIDESGIVPVPTVKPPPGAPGPMRERQITFVDDELTEQARLASVLIDSVPPTSAEPIRARLAPLGRIPALAKSIERIGEGVRDPKTAFVIGFVDGVLPLETIIEVTGLPEAETVQILERLIAQGAVIFPKRR